MSESTYHKDDMSLSLDEKERMVFIPTRKNAPEGLSRPGLCFQKKTRLCLIGIGGTGVFFILMGIIILSAGRGILHNKIISSMALKPGSDRFASWLRPPVQPHLSAYAFHVENPEGVLRGDKPRVREVGPFVYSSSTLKDTDDTLKWESDNEKITYRPRKLYQFVPELSEIKDPENTFVTVPNIPFWTYLNNVKKKGGPIASGLIETLYSIGSVQPFVNVSLAGLLWGYHEEIPCLKLNRPQAVLVKRILLEVMIPLEGMMIFSPWMMISHQNKIKINMKEVQEPNVESEWDKLVKPKAEFMDCKCNWGLFRDRNVTLRKPIEFMSGISDLSDKGKVLAYDGKTELGWWKKGSTCDKVRGQDSSTLPPSLARDMNLEIFIALMCRPIDLTYEKDTSHAGIPTYRFVPPINALGSHLDSNKTLQNPDNECYCLSGDNYECFKSGVYSMEPCKRDTNAPLALSYPHFYQADPSFLEGVEGLNPQKEKHEFYMDVVPEFGFPLAIRPRFQLNVVIGDVDIYDEVRDVKKTVLPFLWAQDGFDEPSEPMAEAIKFGLDAPQKLPMLISVVCFLIGALFILSSVTYFLYVKRVNSSDQIVPNLMSLILTC
ncbi:LOW QUALITY PROTEIN: lysosome membrane protein 2-like [Lepeophtheirus salmonis]|uniref:LOW QUALITY PROTEIN: lysosome membrane protein 2-like n=1 Tax=Lepeophtheirus salmonis TaxID=72036 RepID=UPI003AF35288